MRITFIGATHEVTGKQTFYIEACNKKFLVDVGMEQGEDYFENVQIPVSPSEIDFVLHSRSYRPFRSSPTTFRRRLLRSDSLNNCYRKPW